MSRRRNATVVAAAACAYLGLQWLGRSYGATSSERREPLAGDEIVVNPMVRTTHSVTIKAPPDRVWPWLV